MTPIIRGVSLINCLPTIFNTILNNRLIKIIEDQLSNSQFSCRENHRTADSNFVLKSLINKYIHKNKKKKICLFCRSQKGIQFSLERYLTASCHSNLKKIFRLCWSPCLVSDTINKSPVNKRLPRFYIIYIKVSLSILNRMSFCDLQNRDKFYVYIYKSKSLK
jgi:hypothetical protein